MNKQQFEKHITRLSSCLSLTYGAISAIQASGNKWIITVTFDATSDEFNIFVSSLVGYTVIVDYLVDFQGGKGTGKMYRGKVVIMCDNVG